MSIPTYNEFYDSILELLSDGQIHNSKETIEYCANAFQLSDEEKMNLLGGMASVTIVKDADGTHVSEYDLQPTVNVILRNANTGWYTYRPMVLDSYNQDLAAQNRFSECTVDAMWALYEDITG